MKQASVLILLFFLAACGGGGGSSTWEGIWTRAGDETPVFDNCGCVHNTQIVFDSLPVEMTDEDGQFNASIDECGLRCFTFIRFFGTSATDSVETPLSLSGAASGFDCNGRAFVFTENASTIAFVAINDDEAEVSFDVHGTTLGLNEPESEARTCEMRFAARYEKQ